VACGHSTHSASAEVLSDSVRKRFALRCACWLRLAFLYHHIRGNEDMRRCTWSGENIWIFTFRWLLDAIP